MKRDKKRTKTKAKKQIRKPSVSHSSHRDLFKAQKDVRLVDLMESSDEDDSEDAQSSITSEQQDIFHGGFESDKDNEIDKIEVDYAERESLSSGESDLNNTQTKLYKN